MSSSVDERLDDLHQAAEKLEEKIRDSIDLIARAEKDAFERGLEVGLSAMVSDLNGKTVVIKTSGDNVERVLDSRAARDLSRRCNCKVIVLSDEVELKDLHDVDLKALGLKRDDAT